MTTLYPTDTDSWQDPQDTDALSTSPDGRDHQQHHADLNAVALAMEAQLVGPVFTSSGGYDDTAAVVLDDAESLTPATGAWLATNTQASDTPALDAVNFTQGTHSVTCDLKFPPGSGNTGSLYFDLTNAVSVGAHGALTMDCRFEIGNGAGANQGFEAAVSDGAGLTGTVATTQFTQDSDSQDVWFTMTVPLSTLTTVKSVGIRKRSGGSGSSSKWVTWWIDNVNLREGTAVDAALGDVDGAVIVPSDYVASQEQFSDTFSAVRSVLDLRTAHANLAGIGGVYNLRDWRLDETGTEDVTEDLQRIVDSLEDGTMLKAPSTAVYLLSDTVEIGLGKRYITFDGQGSRWVQPTEVNSEFFRMSGTENTIRGVRGFSQNVVTSTPEGWVVGDATHPVVGTPTANGTTAELNALDEQVEIPWKDDDAIAYYARDHLGVNSWAFTLADTNHVASDCKISVLKRDGTVLQSQLLTLTGTPTEHLITYTPLDLTIPLRVAISKATATANTISISSATLYGRQTYDANLAFNHLVRSSADGFNIRIFDCWAEGMGGDGFTTGSSVGLYVEGCTARVVGRQGVSFNQGQYITMRNCDIIGAARHSIDLEPETVNSFVSDVRFENCRFMDPGLGHVACTKARDLACE